MRNGFLAKKWRDFVRLCLKAQTEKQLIELLDLFLTDAEQEDIAMRYAIVKELLSGKKTQREIAHQLKISTAKITRGSNALRSIDPRLKDFICL
jgi:TrpR family transcriptional regulator, trp operon repressor